MQSIIDKVLESLKQEFEEFFAGVPKLEDVEAFSWEKLKHAAVELTVAYAEEIDKALYKDKSGRKAAGMSVERRGNTRTILTDIGEIRYNRTYYTLKDGTYDHPVDSILGVDSYQRVSDRILLKLTGEARTGSYARASRIVTDGSLSKQSVLNAVRKSRATEETASANPRHVPVLHIDADEDHVNLQNGKNLIVPLVTVYEGLEKVGGDKSSRRKCINAFHHSACEAGEDFWNDVYEKIISRYDLSGTRIYLHGDGAPWIKQGLDFLPNCTFVLDCYHKNKAKKMLFAGSRKGDEQYEKRAVAGAFKSGNREVLIKVGKMLIKKHPEHRERIEDGLRYLYKNLDAIAIRYRDSEAKNGGATEPHVSHVLSSRLSSRPMGWSIETLEHLVPILASGKYELIPKDCEEECSDLIEKAAETAAKAIRTKRKGSPFFVDPNRCVSFEVLEQGRVTQLYCTMRGLSR